MGYNPCTRIPLARFVRDSRKLYGEKFDFIHLPNTLWPTSIIAMTCLKHGDYYTEPNRHLSEPFGDCKLCQREATKQKSHTP